MSSLLDALQESVHTCPDKPFLYDKQGVISFRELDEQSDRLATAFLQIGIQRGDKIGICALNQPEWLMTFFAAAKIGAVVVTLNPRYRAAEFDYMLNQSECKALVCLDTLQDFDYASFFGQFRTHVPKLTHYIFIGNGFEGSYSFAQLAEKETDREQLLQARQQVQDDDTLIMIYTSGTTGKPKGSMITHRSMTSSARAEAQHLRFGAEDNIICSLPLSHVGGITCTILSALVSQASVTLIPSFRPDWVLEAIHQGKPTIMAGVPTMYVMLLTYKDIDRCNFSPIRYCIVGGSNVDPDLLQRIRMKMPQARIINLYGLSETSGACVLSPLHDEWEEAAKSLGVAIGDYQIKVVDEHKQEVPRGAVGELTIQGECVAKGYYDMPEETEEAFGPEGWLYTGDLASIDENGLIHFKGRKKEMYIQGGYNVYPIEIENVLASHPKVAIAAGIGVPHEVYGEVGHYYIVPVPDQEPASEELMTFCRACLADYKVPFSFEFVNQLPLTPAGKVQKVTLKQQYAQERSMQR
jgi:acyl-CoA synthetase (AMP-forming)/AMP-acid ligase II